MKLLKRLFCKHEYTIHVGDVLERQDDKSWKVHHIWKCKKCGKIQR